MLAAVETASETFLLRQREFIDHHGLVLFFENRIKGGLVDIEIPARILAGHAHAVKTEDNVERIDKVMGMFRIGKDPALVGVKNFQVGVKSAVVHLHAPVVLRKTPLILRT